MKLKSLCRFCLNRKSGGKSLFLECRRVRCAWRCRGCRGSRVPVRNSLGVAGRFGPSLEFEFDLVQVDRVGSTGGSADEAVAWAGGSAQVRMRDGVVRRVDCFSISEVPAENLRCLGDLITIHSTMYQCALHEWLPHTPKVFMNKIVIRARKFRDCGFPTTCPNRSNSALFYRHPSSYEHVDRGHAHRQ
jgi:hypothetical protein